MNLAKLGDGGGTANGREAAFVDVVEVLPRFSLQVAQNIAGRRLPLLDGGGCDSGTS